MNDHDGIDVGRIATIGFVALFPGLRRFILFVGLSLFILGAFAFVIAAAGGFPPLHLCSINHECGTTNVLPTIFLFVSGFGIILIVGLWLPATLAAMAGRRVKNLLTDEEE